MRSGRPDLYAPLLSEGVVTVFKEPAGAPSAENVRACSAEACLLICSHSAGMDGIPA